MTTKAERDAWKKQLVDEAEQKILDLTDSTKFKQYLNTLSKFHGYSQRNIELIYSQDPSATQVAGFKQWQNDFNRHVNKGAKSIRISAPIIKKLTEEEKEKLDTTEDKAIVGYRFIPIFDIRQTSGEHVLVPQDFIKENLQEHKNVTNLYEAFKDYLNQKTNLAVGEENIAQPGVKGYFVPKTNEIMIDNKEQDSALKLKTLYHEYAHSQLHGLTAEFKDRPREYKETQAEAVAYVAMKNIGVDTSDYSLGYVATWAQDRDVIHKALSEIQKVSNKTIDLTAELTEQLKLDQKQDLNQNEAQQSKPQAINQQEELEKKIAQLTKQINTGQERIDQNNKIIENAPYTYEASLVEEQNKSITDKIQVYGRDLAKYKVELNNLTKDKEPTLSDQYKVLNNKVNNQNANQQENKQRLKEIRQKISEQTQQSLKEFAKENPDLQKNKVQHQPTIQR